MFEMKHDYLFFTFSLVVIVMGSVMSESKYGNWVPKTKIQ